jgi:hypothetical protein
VAAGAAVAEAVPPGDTCGSGFFLGRPGLRLTGTPVEAHGLCCADSSIRRPVLGFFPQSSARSSFLWTQPNSIKPWSKKNQMAEQETQSLAMKLGYLEYSPGDFAEVHMLWLRVSRRVE